MDDPGFDLNLVLSVQLGHRDVSRFDQGVYCHERVGYVSDCSQTDKWSFMDHGARSTIGADQNVGSLGFQPCRQQHLKIVRSQYVPGYLRT